MTPIEPSTGRGSHAQITCLKGEALWELVLPVVRSVLHTEGADKVGGRHPGCVGQRACARLLLLHVV